MKKKLILGMALGLAVAAAPVAQAMTLEDRVGELEANQSLNIFKFSGALSSMYDSISTYRTKGVSVSELSSYGGNPSTVSTYAPVDESTGVMRLNAQLNIDAEIAPKIKFYSRYTVTKLFNEFVTKDPSESAAYEVNDSDDYDNNRVTLEKAYADIGLGNSGVTFSFGRLPTSDGSPTHLWHGKARMGTYSLVAYNSVLDGYALSHRLDISSDQSFRSMAIYSPFSYTDRRGMYQKKYVTGLYGKNAPNFWDMYAVQLDYTHNNPGFARYLNVIFQHLGTNKGIYPNPAGDISTLEVKVAMDSLNIELNDIASTGLDFVVGYLSTQVDSSGDFMVAGTGNTLYSGFGTSNTNEDSVKGTLLIGSLRYTLPTRSTFVGYEYVKGSKGVFKSTAAAEDLTSFYATVGTGQHLYVTQKYQENVAFTLGHRIQKWDYTALDLNEPSETDKEIKTTYMNVRVDF